MFDFWKDELTPEETDALLNKAATEIKKRKMQVPAILAIEMHRPLNLVAANAATAMAPFLVPFLGFDNVNDYSRLLAKSENVDRLIAKLEEPDREDSED